MTKTWVIFSLTSVIVIAFLYRMYKKVIPKRTVIHTSFLYEVSVEKLGNERFGTIVINVKYIDIWLTQEVFRSWLRDRLINNARIYISSDGFNDSDLSAIKSITFNLHHTVRDNLICVDISTHPPTYISRSEWMISLDDGVMLFDTTVRGSKGRQLIYVTNGYKDVLYRRVSEYTKERILSKIFRQR